MEYTTEWSPREVEFRGTAKEWFGIWIVNLFLTIVTVGIYSAWAKVRRKKYFYNNTYVANRNFDYHATGKQILVGRVIIVGVLVVFQFSSSLHPWAALVLFGLLILALPWFVARALRFNARMSSFSNVRFDFIGTPGRAALPFFLFPILAFAIFLGLLIGGGYILATTREPIGGLMMFVALPFAILVYPLIDRRMKFFSVNNHRLGLAPFEFEASYFKFLSAAMKAAFLVFFFLILTGILVFTLSKIFGGPFGWVVTEIGDELTWEEDGWLFVRNYVATLFVGYFTSVFAVLIYQALIRNVVYNNTILAGEFRFNSDVTGGGIFWIAISNFAVVVATLGLMLPWAQIRLAKYLAAHTKLTAGGSLDQFVSAQEDAGMAVGDAYSDIEGIDLGLPI